MERCIHAVAARWRHRVPVEALNFHSRATEAQANSFCGCFVVLYVLRFDDGRKESHYA